jgi:hypothetical protein
MRRMISFSSLTNDSSTVDRRHGIVPRAPRHRRWPAGEPRRRRRGRRSWYRATRHHILPSPAVMENRSSSSRPRTCTRRGRGALQFACCVQLDVVIRQGGEDANEKANPFDWPAFSRATTAEVTVPNGTISSLIWLSVISLDRLPAWILVNSAPRLRWLTQRKDSEDLTWFRRSEGRGRVPRRIITIR